MSQSQFSFWAFIGLSLMINGCQDAGFIAPLPELGGNSLNSPRAEEYPHLSYDGRLLVFASDRGKQRQILLYDVVGRRFIPLPGVNQPGRFQDQPALSADGRYLVYVSEQGGKPDIWFYDRQTLESKNITEDWIGEVRHPSISGNGRWIVFESNKTGQWDLVLYDRGINTEVSMPSVVPSFPP